MSVPLRDDEFAKLRQTRPQLMEYLDLSNNLEKLCNYDCITWNQRRVIQSKSKDWNKNECLLDIMMRRSHEAFLKFINWLSENGQPHLARLLRDGGGEIDLMRKSKNCDLRLEPIYLWIGQSPKNYRPYVTDKLISLIRRGRYSLSS